MSHIEQVEFLCPQCRKRTIARLEEEVYCPKCDVPMNPQEAKVPAAAAANAPTRSGAGGAVAKTKTRSKAVSKTATAKVSKSKKAKAAAAALVPDVPQVVVGDFRCACCGFTQTCQPGEKKPGTVLRCPSCFVKLEKVK